MPGSRIAWIPLALSLVMSPASAQNERPQTVAAQYLIAIDPGHGGSDAGASGVGSSVLEKNLVLDLALQLGKLLQANSDIAVAYTRNSDIAVNLVHRAEIANYSQGTLLVSLHAGASGNLSSHGARVFFLPQRQPKTSPPAGMAAEERRLAAKTSAAAKSAMLRLVPWERAHEPFDAASASLAAWLQGSLNTLYGTQYDICPVPLYLFQGAQMPAVLVEVGYLSHQEDDARLQTAAFQRDLVAALGRGITGYLAGARGTNRGEH